MFILEAKIYYHQKQTEAAIQKYNLILEKNIKKKFGR